MSAAVKRVLNKNGENVPGKEIEKAAANVPSPSNKNADIEMVSQENTLSSMMGNLNRETNVTQRA
jgi:hypothetical protein